MNDFIQLRKDYVNHTTGPQFPLTYLEKLNVSEKATPTERIILDQLKVIFQLQYKKELTQSDMRLLLSYLGADESINAYVVTLFIKNPLLFKESSFKKQVKKLLFSEQVADATVYALLDSFIELDCDWLSKENLLTLTEKEAFSLDTFSMIIDYFYSFRKTEMKAHLIHWLAADYPITISIQLMDLFVELYSLAELKETIFLSQKKLGPRVNYLEVLQQESQYTIEGLTILQSMFYGDFENSGKGSNGGLSIFLKNLGKELSKSPEIARVITLAITNEWSAEQSIIREYSHGHLLINIPLLIDRSKPTEFLKKEYFIKRTVQRFLKRLALKPDIYHIRFLDNASKAIAQISEEQGKKLVVTLAPDPHRNMTDQTGGFNHFTYQELLEKLNKILVGDELVAKSDKIVGIGSRVVKEELLQYFPQLKEAEHQNKIQMISEGIQTDLSLIQQEGKVMTTEEFQAMGLTKAFLEKPIILNVGRLNQLKAQDQLLKAWIHSELSADYNLLIVGGDLHHPNAEEKEIISIFEEQLAQHPQLKNRFLHLSALSNDKIRKLEQKIRAEQKDDPQIYLCSSKKEEFGIAILEALSQGFLVIGPKKGGVKSYLRDGENGFLIDTTNWQTIAEATVKISQALKNKSETFERIQYAGKKTVKENFSMAIITEDFLSLYLSLQETE